MVTKIENAEQAEHLRWLVAWENEMQKKTKRYVINHVVARLYELGLASVSEDRAIVATDAGKEELRLYDEMMRRAVQTHLSSSLEELRKARSVTVHLLRDRALVDKIQESIDAVVSILQNTDQRCE